MMLLALLLAASLAVTAGAISFGGGYMDSPGGGGESGGSGGGSGVSQGVAKEFGTQETDATEETAVETTAEATEPAPETTVPETEAQEEPQSLSPEMPVQGGEGVSSGSQEPQAEAPAETAAAEESKPLLPPAKEKESLVEKLLLRKVGKTDGWKLIVPAIGMAVALVLLFLKKKKTPKSGPAAPEHTTMSSWEDMEHGE